VSAEQTGKENKTPAEVQTALIAMKIKKIKNKRLAAWVSAGA